MNSLTAKTNATRCVSQSGSMAACGGTRRSSRDLPLEASPLPAYKARAPDARGPIPNREATAPITSEHRSCLATPTVKCEPSKNHTVQVLSVPSRTGGVSPVWHGRRRDTPLARRSTPSRRPPQVEVPVKRRVSTHFVEAVGRPCRDHPRMFWYFR